VFPLQNHGNFYGLTGNSSLNSENFRVFLVIINIEEFEHRTPEMPKGITEVVLRLSGIHFSHISLQMWPGGEAGGHETGPTGEGDETRCPGEHRQAECSISQWE
jgi:hypothetical protein